MPRAKKNISERSRGQDRPVLLGAMMTWEYRSRDSRQAQAWTPTGTTLGRVTWKGWQGCQRPASLAQPTRLMPTKLDEHPDFMAANQPPLYLPPPTEFEYNEVNWPFLPTKEKENKLSDILSDLPSQEEFDSYLYPGSVDLHDVLAQGCQQFPSMS